MDAQSASVNISTARRALSRYRTPHRTRSILELAITAIPFFLLWALLRGRHQRGTLVRHRLADRAAEPGVSPPRWRQAS